MKNYNQSAMFMVLEKVIKMATQLVTIVLLAKFLGPESLGSLMYCFAIASVFIFLNQLGLDGILVKHFVEQPNKKYSFLKNAFAIRLIAAFICFCLINVLGIWLVDENIRSLLFVISVYHLFLPATVFEWYFQSQGRGDCAALGQITGHIVGFSFRFACLYFSADLIWFGAAYIVESAFMFLMFFLIAARQQIKYIGSISTSQIKLLLKDSGPLILSGAIVLLYMKVDQIMLGRMVNDTEVGIYVAATRLSEAWYFVGLTIITAYFPKFLHLKKTQNEEAYYQAIIKVGRLVVWSAIFIAAITVFISPYLISFLYGAKFVGSVDVLNITIWAVPFVYLGTISSKMYIAAAQNKKILWRSITGLIINFILNVCLIPIYGAIGAAISTLVAQLFASFMINFILDFDKNVIKTQLNCMLIKVHINGLMR